jgi:hypothetical protein
MNMLILAYAVVRNISFQTVFPRKANDQPDTNNVYSTDAASPKRRSPLLPKRRSSIVESSSTTPVKFGGRIFATPAAIEDTLHGDTPLLKEKEPERNPVEGKVARDILYLSTNCYLVRSVPTSSSSSATLRGLPSMESEKTSMFHLKIGNDIGLTGRSEDPVLAQPLDSEITTLQSFKDVIEVGRAKRQCTKKRRSD